MRRSNVSFALTIETKYAANHIVCIDNQTMSNYIADLYMHNLHWPGQIVEYCVSVDIK